MERSRANSKLISYRPEVIHDVPCEYPKSLIPDPGLYICMCDGGANPWNTPWLPLKQCVYASITPCLLRTPCSDDPFGRITVLFWHSTICQLPPGWDTWSIFFYLRSFFWRNARAGTMEGRSHPYSVLSMPYTVNEGFLWCERKE